MDGDSEAARSAYRALLGNHNYRFWFASALGSGLGDWTGLVALQVLVVQLTPDGSQLAVFALGGIMMARLLPSIIIGPVAGVLADRYDRKRLMVVTNLCRGAMFVVIALSTDVWALFALTFLVECLTLLFIAAKDASLPVIVRRDQLQAASQLNLMATFGPFPLGALVATAMIPVAALLRDAGLQGANAAVLALLLNAVTFFVSAALLSRLSLPEHGRRAMTDQRSARPEGLVAELREGIAFIRGLPVIRALITGVVGVFFSAGVVVALGPVFVRESLAAPETGWFAVMSSVGIGLALGLMSVPLVTRRLSRERVFPVALVVTGLVATLIATLQTLMATLAMALLLGAAVGVSVVLGYTLLQEHTEDHVRGKTFAAFYTSTRIAMFAALGLGPFLAGFIGTGTLILGGFGVRASGVRIMIFLAGLLATASALGTLRGIYRSLRDRHATRPVSLGQLASPGSRGLFISLEGVEGAGKSTQARRLAETLAAEGHDVVLTREPGGSQVGERIREVLLDPDMEAMDERTEALLYAATRAEHVQKVILPALEAGKVVVCDRFVDSSLAYQGRARGLGEADVFEINRWATGALLPDVTVLLHLDAETGLERAGKRAEPAGDTAGPPAADAAEGSVQASAEHAGDRLEREGLAFHRQVAEGFLELARRDRRRYCVIDASIDEPDAIARQLRLALHAWLPLPASQQDTVTDTAPADGPSAGGPADGASADGAAADDGTATGSRGPAGASPPTRPAADGRRTAGEQATTRPLDPSELDGSR